MQSGISNKVLLYEDFVNEILRKDLQKLDKLRDKCFEEIAQYLQLQAIIEKISKDKYTTTKLQAQVDLGCNFYAQAAVSDPSKIFVCVGYGFYVEFTHQEALTFIEKKTKHLNGHVEKLSKDMAKVRAQIRMVVEGLRELQNIDMQ